MKNLSRNTPVAFVVGAAGFLGSHLCEALLDKNIQVVGVDDLSTGRLENLVEASKDRAFSFLNQRGSLPMPVNLSRLDYAFFVLPSQISEGEYLSALKNFLKICQQFKARVVFISSVDLYDAKVKGLQNLRQGEGEVAGFAAKEGLNARVVRLVALYGPRMSLEGEEPLTRLLGSDCRGELQKEITALDFSTRALFIDDAVNLLIKAVMHGATSQKIYDGVGLPIKISEIKQILLDPLWHESRMFVPTELPPWPTPNLEKTERELSWRPRTSVIEALKKTLAFFRENPECAIRKAEEPAQIAEEKKQAIAEIFNDQKKTGESEVKKIIGKRSAKWGWPSVKKNQFEQAKVFLGTLAGVFLIAYGLIYPVLSIGAGVYSVKVYLGQGGESVKNGNFETALMKAAGAKAAAGEVRQTLNIFTPLGGAGLFKNQFQSLESLLEAMDLASGSSSSLAEGARTLAESFQIISGEKEGELKESLAASYREFDSAEKGLSRVSGRLSAEQWRTLPGIIKDRIAGLQKEAEMGQEMAKGGRAAAFLLAQTVGEGDKKYLILAQDNTTLRSGGGIIEAYAEISFKDGKLAEIKTGSVEELDSKLAERIKPPSDVETDLKESAWLLRDSNQEVDFPTNARWAQWFYEKESGSKVDGVISLDLTVLQRLLEVVGPVTPEGRQKRVDGENLFDEVQSPQDKGKILGGILKEALNRIFFLPKRNWMGLGEILDRSLSEKHLLIYLADAKLLPYLKDNQWAGAMPAPVTVKAGERQNFFQAVESNLSAPGLNKDLTRAIAMVDSLDTGGIISHRLNLNYANPGTQSYSFRLKIYLSSGTKMQKVVWGGEDLSSKVSSFSDFGRSGYSLVLELKPAEQKALRMEYQDGKVLEFKDGKVLYRLNVLKQAGTGEDQLEYRLSLPESFKTTGETFIKTNLSRDRTFEFLIAP